MPALLCPCPGLERLLGQALTAGTCALFVLMILMAAVLFWHRFGGPRE